MRRYLQGTLDFHCGMYAVINALSLLHGIDLNAGRKILAESVLEIATSPFLLNIFLQNQTDHYWVIDYMLNKWCTKKPFALNAEQPFTPHWLSATDTLTQDILENANAYLPEEAPNKERATEVWNTIEKWCATPPGKRPTKVALVRFHRFLPNVPVPIISHWTTVARSIGTTLALHDASGEQNSMHSIEIDNTKLDDFGFTPLLLVPESLVLLSVQNKRCFLW